MTTCCEPATPNIPRRDYLFRISLGIIVSSILLHLAFNALGINISFVHSFGQNVIEMIGSMWWGALIGILFVGLMGQIPKEYFSALLGRGDTIGGIFRAAAAGVLLDLCSHGILMVGAKLYERGASLAQIMTFLIASPWNSFSLTFILIAMIGLKWTLAFIALSAVVAIATGLIYLALVRAGILPDNPNTIALPADFNLGQDAKARLKTFSPTRSFWSSIIRGGWHDGKMILRWLLFGIILAAAIRTFVPMDTFAQWYGPTLAGLALTLLTTTLIEVCSEGATPIAADLVMRAHAPGNGFAFLMAGVSTDYTEIMVLKKITGSWKIALSLPLLTVPQIMVLGWILNHF